MRSKFTTQQKFDMVMDCRSSGLSDYMWCKKHDIQTSTFYSWVKQLKRNGANVPERTYAQSYHVDTKPDIVKLEIVDEVPMEQAPIIPSIPSTQCALEITIGQASIKVFNDVSPTLLSQVISCLGGRL